MWQIFNRSHIHEWKNKLKMYRVTADLCTELKNVTFKRSNQKMLIDKNFSRKKQCRKKWSEKIVEKIELTALNSWIKDIENISKNKYD